MGLCETTESTFGVPEINGENRTKLENSSGYYLGELPQPSRTG